MNLEVMCPWSDFINSIIHVFSDYFSTFSLLSVDLFCTNSLYMWVSVLLLLLGLQQGYIQVFNCI